MAISWDDYRCPSRGHERDSGTSMGARQTARQGFVLHYRLGMLPPQIGPQLRGGGVVMAQKRRSGCPADDCVAADPPQYELTSGEIAKIVPEPKIPLGGQLYRCSYCRCVYIRIGVTKEIIGDLGGMLGEGWHPKAR